MFKAASFAEVIIGFLLLLLIAPRSTIFYEFEHLPSLSRNSKNHLRRQSCVSPAGPKPRSVAVVLFLRSGALLSHWPRPRTNRHKYRPISPTQSLSVAPIDKPPPGMTLVDPGVDPRSEMVGPRLFSSVLDRPSTRAPVRPWIVDTSQSLFTVRSPGGGAQKPPVGFSSLRTTNLAETCFSCAICGQKCRVEGRSLLFSGEADQHDPVLCLGKRDFRAGWVLNID